MPNFQPLQIYREMLSGILRWQNRSKLNSDALEMILQLAKGRRLLAPDLNTAEYESIMAPVYQQLEREVNAKAGHKPSLIQDPIPVPGYPVYQTEGNSENDSGTRPGKRIRYTEPYSTESAGRMDKTWQVIIQQEFIRVLLMMENWKKTVPDEDVLYFEMDNLRKAIHELLQMAVVKEKDTVQQIMNYELAALHKEVHLRRHEYLTRVESDPFTEPAPEGVIVLKSGYWRQIKMEALLDRWTAKYYHTAPVQEIMTLLVHLSEEIEYRRKSEISHIEAAGQFRHFQMILLLIILKKADTEKLKNELKSGKHAENLLRQVDSLLQHGGNTPEETGQILDFAGLLDSAGSMHDIQKFPVISERTDKIKQILNQAFSAPPPSNESRPNLAASGRLPTAAERLRHDYLTFPEIVKLQNSTQDNVRRLLKNLGIKIIKRGDVKYVNYNDYVKADSK